MGNSNSMLVLAEQWVQNTVPIVDIVLIVYFLIGLLHDCFEKSNSENIEELPMVTKIKYYVPVCSKSALLSVWTMSAYLMAGCSASLNLLF